MAEKAILYDSTKCTACRGCQVACKQWNELEGEETANWGSYENPKDLSTQTWLKMEFREVGNNGNLQWLFTRRSCMHCTDAACVKVCPTGALFYHPLGFVSYDKGKCSGCGYCSQFCPYHVPRLNTVRASGLGRMAKCTACTTFGLDRIDNNEEPACVKTCPPKALIYGDRAQLVTTGKARVKTLQAQGYSNANLYGEKELGGLHVMYVLADSPEVYGLPKDPQFPAAATAWQDVIKPLGYAAVGIVGLGLLLNIMVARAKLIKEKEGK
jgi:formate dehydrogenase beta subunit